MNKVSENDLLVESGVKNRNKVSENDLVVKSGVKNKK